MECTNLLKLQIPNSVSFIDKNIVSYSKNVIISGYANSSAALYASQNKIAFNVITSISSNNFSLKKSELSLMVGEKRALEYTITPDNTTDPIIWKSSDIKIATVVSTGVVTTISMGSVSILATTTSGKKITTCFQPRY